MSTPFRPYQAELYARIHDAWNSGLQTVMPVMPTGAGKTLLFTRALQDESAGSIAIAHRQELVTQMSLTLARNGVRHRIIGPQNLARSIMRSHIDEVGANFYDARARVGVASIDTLVRQNGADSWINTVRTWVQDEGHHLLKDNKWGRGIALLPPQSRGMAPTATPVRGDRKGLGRHAHGLMDILIEGPQMRWLIEQGYLSDYRLIGLPSSIDVSDIPLSSDGDYSQPKLRDKSHKSKIHGDVVKHYLQFAKGKLGLTFAVDVEDAIRIAQEYRARGVSAEVVTAKTPDLLRRRVMQRFKNREVMQLVNVDLFGEGVDIPAVEVVSFARPTLSLSLYMQQFGRALRIMEGKERAIVLDHVNNMMMHGLPDRRRTWTLDAGEARSKNKVDPNAVRVCTNCLTPYERFRSSCPACNERPAVGTRSSIEEVDGNLVEIDPEVLAKLRGEIDRIDSAPRIPQGLSIAAQRHIHAGHLERQDAQNQLRDTIKLWSGYHSTQGSEDSEIYKRFFLTFGLDIMTAQTLNARDANELKERILNEQL